MNLNIPNNLEKSAVFEQIAEVLKKKISKL
jgi:hypothetical protein